MASLHSKFNEYFFLCLIRWHPSIRGLASLTGPDSGDLVGVLLDLLHGAFGIVVVFRFGTAFISSEGDDGGDDSAEEPSLKLNKLRKQVLLEIKVKEISDELFTVFSSSSTSPLSVLPLRPHLLQPRPRELSVSSGRVCL